MVLFDLAKRHTLSNTKSHFHFHCAKWKEERNMSIAPNLGMGELVGVGS